MTKMREDSPGQNHMTFLGKFEVWGKSKGCLNGEGASKSSRIGLSLKDSAYGKVVQGISRLARVAMGAKDIWLCLDSLLSLTSFDHCASVCLYSTFLWQDCRQSGPQEKYIYGEERRYIWKKRYIIMKRGEGE